ncbi:MAG TPA: SHOCT domain-containing protein [Conexibacter sp.]|nr:SHOCT domain-containing protein [Conexibacter sp.]
MGLFDKLRRGRMDDPVEGTAQVVAASGYHGEGIYQNCRMELIVQADGVPPTAVNHHGLVHNKRWPRTGTTLPVTVDRSDPRRFTIEWDRVPDRYETARDTSEQLAALMRGDLGAAAGTSGGIFNSSSVEVVGDISNVTEEQRAKLRALGIDLDQVAGATAAGAPAAGADADADDTLSRLERLQRLREQGVLTDAEFAEQKRRILGDG